MSYGDALRRIGEIESRFGMESWGVRSVSTDSFRQVLATAKSRFEQGPARIVTPSSSVPSGMWGNSQNVSSVPTNGASSGAAAAQSIGSPGFATPNAVNGWSPDVANMMRAASQKFNVPQPLLTAMSRAESAFRSTVASPAGAVGMMQLMPGTAQGLGVTDIRDPWQNIAGGAKYLRQLLDRFDGDVRKAVAAYNAGPGAVEKAGGVPPYRETQDYVARVFTYARELGFDPSAPMSRTGSSTA